MTDERVIAYLLGELTEDQSDRFEEELFSADEWQTDMKGVEDDLIDDYLRGKLSPERKRLFEENFLRSESRCQRVVVATALVRRVDQLAAAPEPSWSQKLIAGFAAWPLALRVPVAAAALVLIAGVVWWFGIRTRPPQSFASLNLAMYSGTRDPSGPKAEQINLAGRDALKITLTLPDNASAVGNYQVQLRHVPDRSVRIYSTDRKINSLTLVILAGDLPSGQYVIKLSAPDAGGQSQPVPGDYRFIVE